MLAHVELVDAVVALLEADGGERGFRHGDIGRARRRHDLRAFEVFERRCIKPFADDELLHLVRLVLAVHRNVHGDARLLDIGIHALDGHQHCRGIDLVGDHGRHVRRAADQPHHLGLDVLFLEETALDRHEIRQGRAYGKYADLDLVLRGRRRSEHCGQRERGDQTTVPHGVSFRMSDARCQSLTSDI